MGLHHWSRKNHHGAAVLLAEGTRRLRPFLPECQGVDVAALVRDAERLLEELRALGPERMGERELGGALTVRVRR